jgi:Na+/proline symporter
MGWVNVAFVEIIKNVFGVAESWVFIFIVLSMLIVGLYSVLSGQWGIVLTDAFQFVVAMAGCIILAVVVVNLPAIGGISGMKASLPPETFSFLPSISGKSFGVGVLSLSFSAFIAHIAIQWWSSWYPGSEPGGGGYVAQKMMATKDERHARLSVLWFSIAHYALRPWPWIIVALCTLILYPNLDIDNKKTGFILIMKDHLPTGLLGLLIAAFMAAYMSTISTHLNWGSSYIVNDLYKRFMVKDKDEKHYIAISRWVTIVLAILSSLMIFIMKSISGAWIFLVECGAGLGLVLILRWYWWRINAWTEIVAMIAPIVGYIIAKFGLKLLFPNSMFFTVLFTTIAWIITMFITKPESEKTLNKFVSRINPQGLGWKKFIPQNSEFCEKNNFGILFLCWIFSIILIYSMIFSIGKLVLGDFFIGLLFLGISIIFFSFTAYFLQKIEKSN